MTGTIAAAPAGGGPRTRPAPAGDPATVQTMAAVVSAESVLRDLRRRRASARHRPRGWELVAWAEVIALLLGYAALGLWLLVGGPPITGRPLELVRAHGAAVA